MIVKIVSGGQTGADRGGLDAAIATGLPHGGWCPKGRIAEDGRIPSKYKLTEMSSKDYIKRTEANVVDSDATIIFGSGKLTGGSKRTVEFCEKHNRPTLYVNFEVHEGQSAVDYVTAWLTALKGEQRNVTHQPELWEKSGSSAIAGGVPRAGLVLNIAGPRASNAPTLQRKVRSVMSDVLRNINGKVS